MRSTSVVRTNVSPLTPEPVGFPPSPTTGRGGRRASLIAFPLVFPSPSLMGEAGWGCVRSNISSLFDTLLRALQLEELPDSVRGFCCLDIPVVSLRYIEGRVGFSASWTYPLDLAAPGIPFAEEQGSATAGTGCEL